MRVTPNRKATIKRLKLSLAIARAVDVLSVLRAKQRRERIKELERQLADLTSK